MNELSEYQAAHFSIVRAFLGEFFPSLVGVAFELGDRDITLAAYVSEAPNATDAESLTTALTEVTADFPESNVVLSVRLTSPRPIAMGTHFVFLRRESD
jgi:hypothetical protein